VVAHPGGNAAVLGDNDGNHTLAASAR
jgi:hypothetical protein